VVVADIASERCGFGLSVPYIEQIDSLRVDCLNEAADQGCACCIVTKVVGVLIDDNY